MGQLLGLLPASDRDFQSQCWADSRDSGQPGARALQAHRLAAHNHICEHTDVHFGDGRGLGLPAAFG